MAKKNNKKNNSSHSNTSVTPKSGSLKNSSKSPTPSPSSPSLSSEPGLLTSNGDLAIKTKDAGLELQHNVSQEEQLLFKEFYTSALEQYLETKNGNGALTIQKQNKTPCSMIKCVLKTIFKVSVALCLIYAIKLYILYQVKYYSLYYLLPPITYPLNKVRNYLITLFTIFVTKVLPTTMGNTIIDKMGKHAVASAPAVDFEKTVIKNAVAIDMCSLNTLHLLLKLIQLQIYSVLPVQAVEAINYMIHLIQLAMHNLHQRIIVGIHDIWVHYHPQSYQYFVSHMTCLLRHLGLFTKSSCEGVKKAFF
ncbi:hypothetical protein AWRI3579_g831 [Hanseniaspora osmophila]|uniref:Uncharacterized protein n=1 Tax=Hanseniaspora osmophila TaxID=56408 RepID=A0A1E5RNH1_9ASCO|nr:hypothetical protein AWRI3579_g831 [Hanseniaspora osmophila]